VGVRVEIKPKKEAQEFQSQLSGSIGTVKLPSICDIFSDESNIPFYSMSNGNNK